MLVQHSMLIRSLYKLVISNYHKIISYHRLSTLMSMKQNPANQALAPLSKHCPVVLNYVQIIPGKKYVVIHALFDVDLS
jgi:hypothetical protein